MSAEKHWTRAQCDTFFEVPSGWLKLREVEGAEAELISYRRSTDDSGPRSSDYDVAPLENAEKWKSLIGRVLPKRGVVEKERTLWIWKNTRIHLDSVHGLGEFLELETVVRDITPEEARAETDEVIDTLELDRSSFLSVPYLELMRENG